jgi:hypothetical protein
MESHLFGSNTGLLRCHLMVQERTLAVPVERSRARCQVSAELLHVRAMSEHS